MRLRAALPALPPPLMPDLPLLLILELVLLGLCTGFLAGLLGLGGGMLMVPFMTIMLTARGFPETHTVKMAVATSLATICFTSLSSVRAHHQRGAVLWPVGGCWRRASWWAPSWAHRWRRDAGADAGLPVSPASSPSRPPR
jgi:hypothetical protein